MFKIWVLDFSYIGTIQAISWLVYVYVRVCSRVGCLWGVWDVCGLLMIWMCVGVYVFSLTLFYSTCTLKKTKTSTYIQSSSSRRYIRHLQLCYRNMTLTFQVTNDPCQGSDKVKDEASHVQNSKSSRNCSFFSFFFFCAQLLLVCIFVDCISGYRFISQFEQI